MLIYVANRFIYLAQSVVQSLYFVHYCVCRNPIRSCLPLFYTYLLKYGSKIFIE